MLLQMAVDTRSTRDAESLGMLSSLYGSGDSWLASLMVLSFEQVGLPRMGLPRM